MSGGQLTWRNVDAPNFSGGNDAFRTAAQLLGRAAAPVQEAMAQYQAEDRLRQSAIAQSRLLQSANPMSDLQSGTALAGIDPGMLSQDAINNMGMEAKRRADVGNVLASTANTRATTNRINTLLPFETAEKQQTYDFNTQANPIKLDSARTSADAAKLSLKMATEGYDVATTSKQTYQSLAQTGAFSTDQSREETFRNLEANGMNPEIIKGIRGYVTAGSAPIKGDANALTLGQQPLSNSGSGPAPNPFNNDVGSVIKGYLPKMFGAEGGSKNGGMIGNQAGASSAFGPAQFTDGTWIDTVRENDPATFMRLGGNKNAILGLRTDQNYHRAMAEKFTEGNAKAIPSGVPVNDASLYAMHFFGRGAGPKVLTADASTPISQLVTAKAIEANPFLKRMTAGEARKWAADTIGKKGGIGPTVANAEALEASGVRTAQAPAKPAYNALTSAPSTNPIEVLQQANDLSNTAASLLTQTKTQGNIYDVDAPIARALASGDKSRDQTDIINDIVKKGEGLKDDPGFKLFSNTATSRTGITNAINYMKETYGVSAMFAGAVIENNISSVNKWFSNDYQSVDTDQLDKFMERYIDKDTKKPKEALLNKGISLVNADKATANLESRITMMNTIQDGLKTSLANAIEADRQRSTPLTQENINKARDKLTDHLKSTQVEVRKLRDTVEMSTKARQRQ